MNRLIAVLAAASSPMLVLPIALLAYSEGPPPRVTGAPGDDPAACTQCHFGTRLNGGAGKVAILLPGGQTYTPGVKQHIQISISDPAQRRWGFEFTARLNSDLANGQAGDLTSTDSFTQTFCETGSVKPCPSTAPVQFISHTVAGTRLGTSNGVTFEFDWTPPTSADAGPVTLYVAGNAANGDGDLTGDHIYTSSVQLTPAVSQTSLPQISSNGVVSAYSFSSTIAPNSWVTIFGTNLSTSNRTWTGNDIVNGNLPQKLDDVTVTINGKSAYVEFINPGQINVLSPDDSSSGPVAVQVTNAAGQSNVFTAQLQPLSPGFFTFDGKYLAATHADNTSIGKPGLFASAPNSTTPAKPGEVVVLYGSGFGATNPVEPPGMLVSAIANLSTDVQMTIGGITAKVDFAGLIPGYAGLYQFNVEVPAAAPDGDQPVVAKINGVA
ncbi:MAG: hypothetical protein JO022_02870, partial [Acidobacteriaceae bacterium]|nr:hypothetical protein [Acidobacteriaceae bacterium]